MTASIQQDALLSKFAVLAYKDESFLRNSSNLPAGWSLAAADAKAPPFAAFAFKNNLTGEVIIAFRGTDGFNDAAANAGIASGTWSAQFQQAMDFTKLIREDRTVFPNGFDPSKVLVTGHSLGGALAQIVAQAYGFDGSTIDPGAAMRIVQTPEFRAATIAAGLKEGGEGASSDFTNHLVVDSVISGGTGEHVGGTSYLPSLTFNGEQALQAFLIGLVNPFAGFAYVIGTDQFSNKHPSEQVSQALSLLSGAQEGGAFPSGSVTFSRKIERYEFNETAGEIKPVYSQTEFEIKDSTGTVQNTVVFSGSGVDRKIEVFDVAGRLTSTTAIGEDGTVTVTPRDGQTTTVSYTPSVVDNLDGTVTTTYKNAAGNVLLTKTAQTFDDGSASSTSYHSDGRIIRTTIDSTGQVSSRTNIQMFDDGSSLETTTYANGQVVESTYDADGQLFSQQTVASPTSALIRAVNQYGGPLIDALSLVRAIQSGNPLPVVTSGLRLANAMDGLDGRVDFQTLAGAANVASGVLSVLSLEQALRRGDTLAAVTAGANAVSFGAQAYAALIKDQVGKDALVNAFGADSALVTLNEALPYLNAINSLAHGDSVGAAVAITDIALMNAGLTSIPYLGQAYAIYSIVTSLFDDDSPPEPWGNASATWSDYNIVASAVGEHGGLETAQGTMNQFIATLNQLATQQQTANPASPIGIVANRLPSLSYRNYTGYALTDIDAVTGVQRNPEVRYDLTGRPYNAPPGTEQSSQSLGERFVRVALARGAIAPLWEAQTAVLQTQQGDPQAGLTEEERAGRNGQLATAVTGAEQVWRPVTLDLDGNGVQTTGLTKTAAFDVDDSGFLKNTAWLNGGDGFLTLDRNLNGQIDSGRELFSNGTLALGARGLAGMRWIDANYDGRIDAADPVWDELQVWRDANGDGAEGAGEKLRLSALGITTLNYTMGTFEQDGQLHQLASPDLAADTSGVRTHVVPEGIVVETTEGQISLLVTRVDDRGGIEANRDGVTTYEDTETIISTADLMANDTLGGVPGPGLTVTSVGEFTHGTGYLDVNGFIHYMPAGNYYGVASFTYTVQDGMGQAATATVDLTIHNVNDAPTATIDQHLRAIYGYLGVEYDESGNAVYVQPVYEPYTGVDYSTLTVGLHDTPITYEDSDGPNNATIVVNDIDDPTGPFTFEIAQQAQKGEGVVYADGRVEYINWMGPNAPGSDVDESGGPMEPDPFVVRVADPHGASTTITVQSQHAGYYNPNLGSGGGGKPVSIDLDGNGFRFTDVDDSNVFFDINGDGWKNRMAWPSAGDGLLAHDIDGDGNIEQANEISFASYKPGAQTDLEALQVFDTNADGLLNAADEKWSRFGIWRDANQDGLTGAGEFRTLDNMGVASISLMSDGAFSVIDGQTVHGVGTVTLNDGSTRQLADVTLAYSNDVLVPGPDGTTQVVRKAAFSEPGEVLEGTAENDLILGKTASNVIYAHEGDDVVFEDSGNDAIDAGAGNDTIYSGADNDIVIGGDGDDVVFAGRGNDLMLGGDGHDALFGEGGNDVGFGGNGNDMLYGGEGNDVLSGDRGDDQVYGGTGNDALFGGAGDDVLTGMEGYDLLYGGDGNDLLDGGADEDTMYGGAGDDTYVVDNANDVVSEEQNEGVDTVRTGLSYGLGNNLENLTLTGSENISGAGNALDNVLTGNSGDNVLNGGEGNDTLNGSAGADLMTGGAGNDIYFVDNAGDVVREYADEGEDTVRASRSYILGENVENLILTGLSSIDGTGNTLDNRLAGNSMDNMLDGGAGADVMSGGRGNDTYVVDDSGDQVIEAADAGVDTVRTAMSHTLEANVERLVLTGAATVNGTGNELDNVLTGNMGSNVLDGGVGADRLAGGAGDDIYVVDNAADMVIENAGEGTDQILASVSYTLLDNIETLTLTGTGEIEAIGNSLNNVLNGNDGINRLDGGAGADVMTGGRGDDTYVVDHAGDVLTEQVGEGYDTVAAAISYVLTDNVERLVLTGTQDITGRGNELDNVIIGNAGSNVLDGGAGADTMIGGGGDDTYFVDNSADRVIEDSDVGYDRVFSSVDYSLEENFEGLTLAQRATRGAGNAFDNVITGNDGDNVLNGLEGQDVLSGGGGNDFLDGGAGSDVMRGGLGDDVYIVGNAADAVTEYFAEGRDSVYSSVSYVLPEHVEALTLTANADIDATGNELDNVLTGNAANNALDGRDGADVMAGGAGDDIYDVDEAGDVVVEWTSDGYDTVNAAISYVLTNNVERLVLTGAQDNTGAGNALDNVIVGNSGNNTLDGSAGLDVIAGGLGDDIYAVDNVADTVLESSDEGWDTIVASVDYVLAENVEALTLAGAATEGTGNDLANTLRANDVGNHLLGLGGDDELRGGAGNDVLDGGIGSDAMTGGKGDDLYFVDAGNDRVIEREVEGQDRVIAGVDHVLALNVEDLTLSGAAVIGMGNNLDNTIVGNASDNVLLGELGNDLLVGASGNDLLDGGTGIDRMNGGVGDDTYVVDDADDVVIEQTEEGYDTVRSEISYALTEQVERLDLTGRGNLSGTGNALDNVIIGNSGDNTLDGGIGADKMIGGVGDDTYLVDNVSDQVVENRGEGIDTVVSAVNYRLTDNTEALILTGSANEGSGNALGNTLTANDLGNRLYGGGGDDDLRGGIGDDLLDGESGADRMSGSAGDDIYVIDDAGDLVNESSGQGYDTVRATLNYALTENVERLELTGASNITGTGNLLDNTIVGNSRDNILDGAEGADMMVGAAGNDTYLVDNLADVVVENVDSGTDAVLSSVTYVLSDNVEILTLTGVGNIDGTGNDLDNEIIGNSGDNRLEGGVGADRMAGGAGNDEYVVDDVADTIIELPGDGRDAVYSSVSYVLPEQVEALTLTGAADIDGTGNALDNALTGNVGSNVLDGGAGGDRMQGGAGDDVYVVDDDRDATVEHAEEGTDTVMSVVSHALAGNIERLVLTGAGDISGTGNGSDNMLIGNSGNNLLDGSAGMDAVAGGLGDDTYVVDDAGDAVTELFGQGRDTVESQLSYVLPSHVEALRLTGAANLRGTGNDLDNAIYGNAGNNVLDGGAGMDAMAGGAGDDVYVVDNSSDRIVEAPDEGRDVVFASASYVLSDNVEDLTLTQADDIDGTGNALNNLIVGNDGANRLDGAYGNDTLMGGLGNDALHGGAGDDVYVYNIGDDLDTITDVSGTDSVRFGAGLSLANVALRVRIDNGVSIAKVRVLDAGGCEQPDQGFDFALDSDPYGAVSSSIDRFIFADGSVRTWDDLLIRQVTTYGNSRTLSIATGRNDDTIVGGPRSDTIRAGTGNDIVYGGSGADTVYGEGGDDYLAGGTVSDTLDGGCGVNVLDGRQGDDVLVVAREGGALVGGNGFDFLHSAAGADFIAGGQQDDTIDAGAGSNVIAFNATDGRDVILPAAGARNTLSLGSNVDADKLHFSRLGADLRLEVTDDNSVTFRNWYADAANQNFVTLQVFNDARGASQKTAQKPRVDTYDFRTLVAAFDEAQAADATLDRWSVMSGLLEAHIASSDSAAVGSDLATVYAGQGDLSGMNLSTVQETLKSPRFGAEAQALHPWQQISSETVRLS